MKVTEIKNDGLKREYKVTLPAKEIAKKVEHKLSHLAQTMKVAGFRPGKVPLTLVRKKHGQAVLGEVLQDLVTNSSQEVLSKEKVQPALQPKIEITNAFDEGNDLEYSISLEVYPEVPEIDFSKVSLKKARVDVVKKDIDDGMERLCKAQQEFQPLKKARAAKKGDAVVIDFEGKLKGVAFAGGTAKAFRLELGSGQFVPGFEDQLIGAKKGDEKTVKVTFPKDYGSDELAGKDVEFGVTVHDILAPELPKADDAFAKKMGYDDLAALEEAIKSQIEKDFEGLSKTKLKKELFDALDGLCTFDVPEGMLKLEYDALVSSAGINPEGSSKEDKKQQKEYKDLASRRVRLGIMLAETGRKGDVTISEDELRKAVFEQARSYPGQEQKVIELYQRNPQALEQLRGPILEEKVVALILEKVKLKEEKTSVKELLEFHESQD